jgi:hypothetical protein
MALADTGASSIIVMGGDSSMQELFAQPDIKSISDLKARTIIVDAPNTAYALVVKKALANVGLRDGQDYALKPTGGTSQRLGLMKETKENAATMLDPYTSELALASDNAPAIAPTQLTECAPWRIWARLRPLVKTDCSGSHQPESATEPPQPWRSRCPAGRSSRAWR